MSEYRVKPAKSLAGQPVVNIERGNNPVLKYVGFEVMRLEAGETFSRLSGADEICVIILEGKADFYSGDLQFSGLGRRQSVHERVPTDSVYVPAGQPLTITAQSKAEIALCKALHLGEHQEIRLLPAEDVEVLERGEGTNKRYIHNIMMANASADSLLITEVYTPAGNWSSYPPHKHDTDDLPAESFLEETYYHRINPPQGYALQRIYTDDRSIDETIAAEDGDTVMVPKGYHPVGAPHGYDLYYLNVMAGPKREWRFRNDPAHEWMLEE